MAKIIRFPLKMKNGENVRTLDELKENFDLESVLGYFTDGKLQKWLADHYYDEKAEAVASLSSNMPNLNAKLCEILGVEYVAEADETNLEIIQRRNEKYRILCEVIDNKRILNNIDFVALNQKDLYDILVKGSDIIYLYGDRFEIPLERKNIHYIGLNEPLVVIEKDKKIINYYESRITIDNTKFEAAISEDYKKINRCREIMGDASFYEKISQIVFNQNELVSLIRKGVKEIYLYKANYIIDLSQTDIKYYGIDNPTLDGKNADILSPFPMENIQGVNIVLIKNKISAIPDNLNEVYQLALNLREVDNEKCFILLSKAAENGLRDAMYSLAYAYDIGRGVKEDKNKAVEWYKKAYDLGHPFAKQDIERLIVEGVPKARSLLKYL